MDFTFFERVPPLAIEEFPIDNADEDEVRWTMIGAYSTSNDRRVFNKQ